ncbi:hypothetical protein Q1695_006526 [Nippostrongylus brasiliensis]|nr:hypothetical protein Q1695_006526 [Nippostrongylus brasiliensis]
MSQKEAWLTTVPLWSAMDTFSATGDSDQVAIIASSRTETSLLRWWGDNAAAFLIGEKASMESNEKFTEEKLRYGELLLKKQGVMSEVSSRHGYA